MSLRRSLLAEFVGTLLLVAAVVGSGIMGERLAGGNVAIALLANTMATACALVALITAFGPVSGAHFNPIVSVAMVVRGDMPLRALPAYAGVQVIGACVGTLVAHLMFELPLVTASQHARSGGAQVASEAVATFTLLLVIIGVSRARPGAVAACVAATIAAAYWFTASTSFANPAVTIARTLTDTFAGIRPADAPMFIAGQIAGAALALGVGGLLWPPQEKA